MNTNRHNRLRITPPSETTPALSQYPIRDIQIAGRIPVTRESYLALSHPWVDPEEPLVPEEEMDLPPELRLGWEILDEA